jgi:MFS family permease
MLTHLRAQVLSLTLGIFLAAMDATIVTSSNAAIGSELKQLQNSTWIATGYMLTLTSSQYADIFILQASLS